MNKIFKKGYYILDRFNIIILYFGGIYMPHAFKNTHVIQKVLRNNNEDVIAYELEDGEIVMKEEAISMTSQGLISGVLIESDGKGGEYLKSTSSGYYENDIK